LTKHPESEAKPLPDLTRSELALLLQKHTPETDASLFRYANSLTTQLFGNKCFVRALVEFCNVCQKDCYYCGLGACARWEVDCPSGIRKSMKGVRRYTIPDDEILALAKFAHENKSAVPSGPLFLRHSFLLLPPLSFLLLPHSSIFPLFPSILYPPSSFHLPSTSTLSSLFAAEPCKGSGTRTVQQGMTTRRTSHIAVVGRTETSKKSHHTESRGSSSHPGQGRAEHPRRRTGCPCERHSPSSELGRAWRNIRAVMQKLHAPV